MVPPFLIKAVVKVVLFVVVISGIYVGLSYSGLLPGSFDLLKRKEATFVDTALNVEEVKAVAKLFTQKYVNEIIIRKSYTANGVKSINDDFKKHKNAANKNKVVKTYLDYSGWNYVAGKVVNQLTSDDKLFIIATGTCYAGTDLSNMKNEDIKVIDSMTVNVTMPKAKILESTINPSGFTMFITEGYWNKNLKAIQKVKAEAVKKLELMAKSEDILKKADLKSISMMKSFMQAVGFKNVNITLK